MDVRDASASKNHLDFVPSNGQWAKSSDGAENLFPDLLPYEWNDGIKKPIKNSKLTSLFFCSTTIPYVHTSPVVMNPVFGWPWQMSYKGLI